MSGPSMPALRRWFRRHWLLGALAIVGSLWLVMGLADAAGIVGFRVGDSYGRPRAVLEFMPEREPLVLALADGVGLELDDGETELRATIVGLEPAPSVQGWVCGSNIPEGSIARITHRQGDWFFRNPSDEASGKAHDGDPESRALLLTLAFNRATGERVMVEVDAPVAEQHARLAARGLTVSEATRLRGESLEDLPVVSVLRESCVLLNTAFGGLALLWLALGGLGVVLSYVARVIRGFRARG